MSKNCEPVKTIPNTSGNGRPEISESQFNDWLEQMRPFLEKGHSVNYAISKCGLYKHRTSMYKKYGENDWFSDKITHFQSLIGELTNEIVFRKIEYINSMCNQTNGKYTLTRSDLAIIKLVALRHRSSSPFFIQAGERKGQLNQAKLSQVQPAKIEYVLPG